MTANTDAGVPAACEGRAPAGAPVPSRAGQLALLERELRAAERTGDVAHAVKMRARIRELSAGSPADPSRETT